MLGEVELILLRRDSSDFSLSSLTPHWTAPCPNQVHAMYSFFWEGTARRERAVSGAAALAADHTRELGGFVHTGNCFLNGLEVARFQVLADMLLPGWAVTWPLWTRCIVWGAADLGRTGCFFFPLSSDARIASKRGYVLGLTFILKENYKGNKSSWPQLKSGGFDLSYLTTSLHGNFTWVPPLWVVLVHRIH